MKYALIGLALFTSFSSFANVNKSCGLSGSLDARIRNCSTHNAGFSLVTRTKEGIEVHQDVYTRLLWSDHLPAKLNQVDAKKACANLKEFAGITGVTWSLPSIQEYRDANKNGIKTALKNMNFVFWSSSVPSYDPSVAFMYNGYQGQEYDYDRDNKISVRCVGR